MPFLAFCLGDTSAGTWRESQARLGSPGPWSLWVTHSQNQLPVPHSAGQSGRLDVVQAGGGVWDLYENKGSGPSSPLPLDPPAVVLPHISAGWRGKEWEEGRGALQVRCWGQLALSLGPCRFAVDPLGHACGSPGCASRTPTALPPPQPQESKSPPTPPSPVLLSGPCAPLLGPWAESKKIPRPAHSAPAQLVPQGTGALDLNKGQIIQPPPGARWTPATAPSL